MGATVPIAELFQRLLGLDTVFFSFSTADEDYHAPNEFFRLDRFRDGLAGVVRAAAAAGPALSVRHGLTAPAGSRPSAPSEHSRRRPR